MTIEIFPAGNGDAILISSPQYCMLIDAGYVSTFRDHLQPRLKTLHEKGRILDKFIVTHIDADHISGAIAFLNENGNQIPRSVIEIKEVWFNSYRHLHQPDKAAGSEDAALPDLSRRGGKVSQETDSEELLVSSRQGTTLGSLLMANNYAWNTHFNENAVKAALDQNIPITSNVQMTILGPTPKALDDLSDHWYTYLREKYPGKISKNVFFDDAFERLMEEERQASLENTLHPSGEQLVSAGEDWVEKFATLFETEDNSKTNGSSITCLLAEGDKTVLLLGDAIPSHVIAQIKALQGDDQEVFKVKVMKVAHHGAWSNNHPELFDLVHADYYIFSSNGVKHHHPHLQTIAWIVKKNPALKTLVFNYRQRNRLSILENKVLQKKYNYKIIWPDVDEFGRGKDGYIKIEV